MSQKLTLVVLNCMHAPDVALSPSATVPCAIDAYGRGCSPGVCARTCTRREPRDACRPGVLESVEIEVQQGAGSEGPVERVQRERWPWWARWVAKHATAEDVGVGSTIERELGAGGRMFKATFAAISIDCGCDDRRDRWDVMYPYAPER